MKVNDTIVALATASGAGAIAVRRISGPDAITTTAAVFRAKSQKKLEEQESHTLHLGNLIDGSRILDEVLVSIFKNPRSYTGEDVVEISCHGSMYIQQEIIQLFIRKGCRSAEAGEFTLRAFLNGKMDLVQAEAVVDLVEGRNRALHGAALHQLERGLSSRLGDLREELVTLEALLTHHLDFPEEDEPPVPFTRPIALGLALLAVGYFALRKRSR
jgi:tRNA modification GTPase